MAEGVADGLLLCNRWQKPTDVTYCHLFILNICCYAPSVVFYHLLPSNEPSATCHITEPVSKFNRKSTVGKRVASPSDMTDPKETAVRGGGSLVGIALSLVKVGFGAEALVNNSCSEEPLIPIYLVG